MAIRSFAILFWFKCIKTKQNFKSERYHFHFHCYYKHNNQTTAISTFTAILQTHSPNQTIRTLFSTKIGLQTNSILSIKKWLNTVIGGLQCNGPISICEFNQIWTQIRAHFCRWSKFWSEVLARNFGFSKQEGAKQKGSGCSEWPMSGAICRRER